MELWSDSLGPSTSKAKLLHDQLVGTARAAAASSQAVLLDTAGVVRQLDSNGEAAGVCRCQR